MRNLILLFVYTLFFSCTPVKEKGDLKYILTGNIGSSPLANLELTTSDNKIDGILVYKHSNDTIQVDGMLLDNDLTLYEYNSEDNFTRTGIFKGNFDKKSYEGVWSKDPKSPKVPFSFSRENEANPLADRKGSTSSNDSQTKTVSFKIIPSQEEDYLQSIYGYYGGERYQLFSGDPWCYSIDTILDLNGDNLNDAIITLGGSCSGNAADPPKSIVSFNTSKNKFIESEPIYSLGLDLIKKGKLIEIHDNQIMGRLTQETESYSIQDVYVLNSNSEVDLLRSTMEEMHKLQAELWADDFYVGLPDNAYERNLLYDLNSNKITDTIKCTMWDRWNLLQCKIHLDNGIVLDDELQGERIGVAFTSTKGYKDIVIRNLKLSWNGQDYE